MAIIPGIVAGFGDTSEPPPDPPPFEYPTSGLLYWFDAAEAESAAGVQAVADDPVAIWPNKGSAEDAEQPTSARRPIFRTGGLAGLPYLECDRATEQYFSDLAFSQPSGTSASSSLNPYSFFAVIDALGPLDNFPAILGNSVSNLGKMNFYFRPTANQQYRIANHTTSFSNVPAGPIITHGAVVVTDGMLRRRILTNGTLETDAIGGSLDTNAISATQFLRNTVLGAGNGFFDGRFYEFLMWDREMTTSEVADVGNALATKYGVTLSGSPPWQH
jgi:hypothetical protein